MTRGCHGLLGKTAADHVGAPECSRGWDGLCGDRQEWELEQQCARRLLRENLA